MDVSIKSGDSANTATVNSEKEILVKPTSTKADVGMFATLGRSGNLASLTGRSGQPYTGESRPIEIDSTADYALRVGVDNCIFQECFVGSTLNNNVWSNATQSSATVTVTGGFAVVQISTAGASSAANLQTYRFFPMYGSTTTSIVFRAKVTGIKRYYKNLELGIGILPGLAALVSDGVFFRWAEDGTVVGVLNNNGNEIRTADIDYPLVDDSVYQFRIKLSQTSVEFSIDDKIVAVVDRPIGANAPMRAGSGCLFARGYNIGFAPPSAASLSVSEVIVFTSGGDFRRDYSHERASVGFSCNNGASGFSTLGTQSNISNSLALTSGTLTNTAAPSGGYTGTTLGGEFQFAAITGSDVDNIIFVYQVPAASVSTWGRTLVVTGLRIHTVGLGAAGDATTPTVMCWSLGFGSTAVSLATTDGAGTRAPVRIPVGNQTFTPAAAIGFTADPIDFACKTPVVVPPGQYLHIICKMPIGVNTASRIFRGVVGIDGYWE